ncbi:unnamed protein product [Euphydryas editha]|uniref:Uncharacterized protein n=1 Tax=Euphydryas editha TaxID=104508 RepID=A0AAU9VBJ5_EUPED|nr:unnamed protein product [Euphydryas editha]
MTSTTEKYGSSECSTNEFKFEMFEKKLQTNCDKIQQLSPGASNIINTDVNGNMWHVALENIFLCITPKQYLTAKILSDIVEIMLNAHDHENSEYTIAHLINRCEQTLAFHFRMHPPCFNHENILNVYQEFLMGEKNKTEKQYSNRHEYECKKGIIKFCFNRLDYEVSSESKDGPLINKDEVTPQELKGTRIKHFENEHLILYELLERSDRIKRLMAVLSSIIELLQFNLLIFKSR